MPYPTGALGTDVSAAATGYIEAYDADFDAILANEQLNANVIERIRAVQVQMAADLAILATVTDA
jgi:hypothetical protein